MQAYRVTVAGMTVPYRAESRERACYLAAKDCHEGGWGKRVGDLLKTARAVRAPELDLRCVNVDEGYIPQGETP
jgi:hypothetical protein